MNLILLLYVLPFFISIIVGYKKGKSKGITKKEYLEDALIMLVPVVNILTAVFISLDLLLQSKITKNIKKYLNQPL